VAAGQGLVVGCQNGHHFVHSVDGHGILVFALLCIAYESNIMCTKNTLDLAEQCKVSGVYMYILCKGFSDTSASWRTFDDEDLPRCHRQCDATGELESNGLYKQLVLLPF
jgi:hypothetical protein